MQPVASRLAQPFQRRHHLLWGIGGHDPDRCGIEPRRRSPVTGVVEQHERGIEAQHEGRSMHGPPLRMQVSIGPDRASPYLGTMTDPVPTPPLRAAIVPVTPLQQNCSIVWCTATMKAAVVDPGGDLPRIQDAITKTGVTVEKILLDRKSTRLNSSHVRISYAVFCLKKKKVTSFKPHILL